MSVFVNKMRKFLVKSAQVFKITLKMRVFFEAKSEKFGFFRKNEGFFEFLASFEEFRKHESPFSRGQALRVFYYSDKR